jgi:citrate synthase
MAADKAFIPSHEATARLGVRLQTLYAYVSRGLIRTKLSADDPRARLYAAADLAALLRRRERQRRPETAAGTALDWGLPVLETRLSSIDGGRLRFRGADAAALAERGTLEEAATLLWDAPVQAFPFPRVAAAAAAGRATDRALAMLAALLADETPGLRGPAAIDRATALIGHLASAAAGGRLRTGAMHTALATAWGRRDAAQSIRRALVLCADHELNASSFAVRVVASTGASLGNCLVAGLAALSGPAHGGSTERVAAFLDEAARTRSAAAAVAARLERGEPIPGFGHPLYPDGDPRARALLADRRSLAAVRGISGAVDAATGLRPNVDLALVALERGHRLPRGSALALFAIGRSVGWVAHALEQWQSGQLIRPRARFIGSSAALS